MIKCPKCGKPARKEEKLTTLEGKGGVKRSWRVYVHREETTMGFHIIHECCYVNEYANATYVTTPDQKKWVNKKGKLFAVAAYVPQPWGNYSVWIVCSTDWTDTKAQAEKIVAEMKAYLHGNAPADTMILEATKEQT